MLRTLIITIVLVLVVLFAADSPSQAAFPGQNGDILFGSSRDGDAAIFRMDADGTDQVKLADSANVDFGGTWSPDGTQIAFTSERDGNREIYVMNADGTGVKRLTNSIGSDFQPAWSPDGERIIFRSSMAGGDAWTVDPENSDLTPLDLGGHTARVIVYSPDGNQLAFTSENDSDVVQVFVSEADGDNPQLLTNSGISEDDPAWSPDGTRIVFVRSISVATGVTGLGGQTDIFMTNANGTGEVNLTNDADYDSQPVWSPDGTAIAFYSDRPPGEGLYLMDPDGSNIRRLLDEAYSPDWQTVPGGALKWGDADCSGTVDPIDALKTLRNDAGLSVTAEPDCPELGADVQIGSASYAWGDIDCSAAADPVDALKLIRYDAGLTVAKPAACYTIDDFVVIAV